VKSEYNNELILIIIDMTKVVDLFAMIMQSIACYNRGIFYR